MQKFIAILFLVFVLCITATFGQSGYGSQGESSRSPNQGHSTTHIETSLTFMGDIDKSISYSLRGTFWASKLAPASLRMEDIRTEATGSELLDIGTSRQRFELKLSDKWDGYDPEKIIMMSSSTAERQYWFCVRAVNGVVEVNDVRADGSKERVAFAISREVAGVELILDKPYEVEARADLPAAFIQFAIFSTKREEWSMLM